MAFQKGQSGNPGGRPRELGDLRQRARERSQDALDALTAIVRDTAAPPAARVAAATAILDRAYGRPGQTVELSGKGGGPIETHELGSLELARRIAFLLSKGVTASEETLNP